MYHHRVGHSKCSVNMWWIQMIQRRIEHFTEGRWLENWYYRIQIICNFKSVTRNFSNSATTVSSRHRYPQAVKVWEINEFAESPEATSSFDSLILLSGANFWVRIYPWPSNLKCSASFTIHHPIYLLLLLWLSCLHFNYPTPLMSEYVAHNLSSLFIAKSWYLQYSRCSVFIECTE